MTSNNLTNSMNSNILASSEKEESLFKTYSAKPSSTANVGGIATTDE